MRLGHGKAIAFLIVFVVLHGVVLAAGFVSPYDPVQQNRELPFASPTTIHFVDTTGTFHVRPFVYEQRVRAGTFDEYEEDRSVRIPVRFFVKGRSYHLLGLIPGTVHLFGAEEAGIHLLGTDGYGRDLFSRILFGGQISLFAGLLAASMAVSIGALVGGISGYFGGWTDSLAMRIAELCIALPWLYLLFGLRAFLPLLVSPSQGFLIVVTAIGVLGWARPARLVRGVALSVRQRDFVRAASGFGASHSYILRRHVLPQTRGVILTQAAILIPQFIVAEVTLSFLGLGIPEPAPSWGNLLSSLQQYNVVSSYWWMYFPALAMVPFFFSYLALASSLQERARLDKIDLLGVRASGRSI